MRFRLALRSKTLDDLELLQVQIFSEFCAISHIWKTTSAKRMKIDPHCQWDCCALKVLFNDNVDIVGRSSARSLQSKFSERK